MIKIETAEIEQTKPRNGDNIARQASYDFLEWLMEAYPQAWKALPANAAKVLEVYIRDAVRDDAA